MNRLLRNALKRLARRLGYQITRFQGDDVLPLDFDEEHIRTIRAVQPFTMTSPERIHALIESVAYIVKNAIPGDMLECGVWEGGSMMAVAETLIRLGETGRHLYLFDTFEGMTRPGREDIFLKQSKFPDQK